MIAPQFPFPDLADVSSERLAEVGYPGKPLLNVTHMGLHLPEALWFARYRFNMAMVYETTIDPWLREILILRVAHLSKCAYELHLHRSISAELGFSEKLQHAIADEDYRDLEEVERVVARFTDQVVRDCRPDDETLQAARRLFSDAQVLEMVVIISSYMGTARLAMTTGIPADHFEIRTWDRGDEGLPAS